MTAKRKPEPPTPPGQTTIHHHAPSAFGAVFSKVLAAIAAAVALWQAGVFLFAKLGFQHPDQALATTLVAGLGLTLLTLLADRFLSRWFAFRKDMRDKDIQFAHYRRLLLQSALADTRPLSPEQARLNSLVLQVMEEAYTYLAKNDRFRGAWRPWSRRNAAAIVLTPLGETEPAGEALAVRAKQFLLRHEVIIDEQVNLQRFPDLAAVQKLIHAPALLPLPTGPSPKIIRGAFR